MPTLPKPLRPIRSYVLRQGRLTPGQQRAFAQHWATFGVEFAEQPLDFTHLFGNSNPVYVEIGCGNGAALAEMALRHPTRNYLGIEVHTPGVGHLLLRLAAQGNTNVRIIRHDALAVLRHAISDQTLAGLYLFFPDPWPKKRHHKRRLVQPDFTALVVDKLVPNGLLHMTTDWEPYAAHMLTVLQANPFLKNTATTGDFVSRPADRPLTRFEQRGQKLGHTVYDLIFRRDAVPGQSV